MAEDLYYTYDDDLNQTLNENDNTEEQTETHTEIIPHNLEIDGDLLVDFQDGAGVHTLAVTSDGDKLEINGTKLVIDTTTVSINNSDLVVNDSAVTVNTLLEIVQQTATNADGIKIIFSGNNWKIFLDTNNDLVFSYNDIIVQKLSHD